MPYFFGYGSLVNLTTHDYPNARPATLCGWRRVWRHTALQEPAFLSIEPNPETHISGVIAQVPDNDWAALDERETGYLRQDVSDQIPNAFAQTSAYFVDMQHVNHDRKNIILLSYLDVVVQGFLNIFGTAGAHDFFETTHNWGEIVNDRAAPRYPRARKLSADELDFVDQQIKIRNL